MRVEDYFSSTSALVFNLFDFSKVIETMQLYDLITDWSTQFNQTLIDQDIHAKIKMVCCVRDYDGYLVVDHKIGTHKIFAVFDQESDVMKFLLRYS